MYCMCMHVYVYDVCAARYSLLLPWVGEAPPPPPCSQCSLLAPLHSAPPALRPHVDLHAMFVLANHSVFL